MRHRKNLRHAAAALVAFAALATEASSTQAITRTEVLVRAKAFAFHPWTCNPANLNATCDSGYKSVYLPGDYMGLPYDWGGYMTLFDFDQQIKQGYGAGSYPEDGVLACTAGLDCSGFVSKAWDAGHFGTATIHQTSSVIASSELLAGDIINKPSYHVVLYSHLLANGDPVFYEAVGYNVHLSMPGWSWVNGYTPRRFSKITGTQVAAASGTPQNPIQVGSFPYTDSRDTSQSKSDVLDGCGAAPTKKETGPEYIYQLTLKQPGTLTVSVQDDVGVDIDVHLYRSQNTNDCVARDDLQFSKQLDCGTYWVVADTFKGSKEYPGNYTINIDFQASSSSCGPTQPDYNFEGGLGAACAYPGNPNLPFCNPNLDATSCIYTDSTSFCSKPCEQDNDCGGIPGGCCGELGAGERYCFTAELCASGEGGGPTNKPPTPPAGDPSGGGGTSAAGVGGASSSGTGTGASDGGRTASFLDDDGNGVGSSSCSVQRGQPKRQAPQNLLAFLLVLSGAACRRQRRF